MTASTIAIPYYINGSLYEFWNVYQIIGCVVCVVDNDLAYNDAIPLLVILSFYAYPCHRLSLPGPLT